MGAICNLGCVPTQHIYYMNGLDGLFGALENKGHEMGFCTLLTFCQNRYRHVHICMIKLIRSLPDLGILITCGEGYVYILAVVVKRRNKP
jgi:hypothetical protein